MAFFTVHGEQCRLQWPDRVGVVDPQPEDVPPWRTLPVEYDELCERVGIDGFGPAERQVVFAHPDLNPTSTVGLALRIQGVVSDINLNVLGNWTGDAEGATKAMQWLQLTGGNYPRAFKPQKEGVNNLEEVVRALMNVPPSVSHPRDGSIKLQRRVFTKVRVGVENHAIKFGRHEDGDGRAAKIAHEWVVDHRIKTGSMDAGRFIPKHTLSIRRGDLVDVLATVEVVSMRGRHGRKTEIYLCPQEVVKLESARDLQARSKRGDRVRTDNQPVNQAAHNQRTQFGFGVGGDLQPEVTPMETAE